MKYTLDSAQSDAVRELSKAVDRFFESELFTVERPLDFAFNEILEKSTIMDNLFPDLLAIAEKYDADWDADLPEWIRESSDHTEAAFEVLHMIVIIRKMRTTFQNTYSRLSRLAQDLSDLSSFSEEYDVEHGDWKYKN